MKKLLLGMAALAMSVFAMPNMALAAQHHGHRGGGHHMNVGHHGHFRAHRGGRAHFRAHRGGRAHFARRHFGRHHRAWARHHWRGGHWGHHGWRRHWHHGHHWRHSGWWWPFGWYGWNDGCWQYRWTWNGYRYVNVCRWNYYY